MNSDLVIEYTLKWIRSFVVEQNLCPFAKGTLNKGTIRIITSNQKKQALALEDLMKEIHFLDENPQIETSLLVFSQGFKDFFAYLELVDLAEELLEQLSYDGVYQIASFHPNYYFVDTDPEDVTNYTNRSPYPILHILREEVLDKAIQAYGDTENIPEKNKETLQKLGLEAIKRIISE